jgi:hypothetical protein
MENRLGRRLGGGGSVCVARAWIGETKDARGRKRSAGGWWLLLRGGGGQQRGGGLATEMPCGVEAAWGLAPTGGRRPDRGPAVTRAGSAPLFRQWRTDAADTRALAVGGTGSE